MAECQSDFLNCANLRPSHFEDINEKVNLLSIWNRVEYKAYEK